MKKSLKLSAIPAAVAALALVLSGCSGGTTDGDGTGLPNDGCTQVVVATSSEKVNSWSNHGRRP